MSGPRCSRRRFIAASGVAVLPVVSDANVEDATNAGQQEDNWLRRYDAASPGTLVDVAPAHGGGWVLAGTDAEQNAGLLLAVTNDGRVAWRRRLAADRDGHLVAVTRTPDGYAVFGRTADADGWLAYLPSENGQPGPPRVAKSIDAIGSTVSVRPRIHPNPDGGIVVADGYVPSHDAITRVQAFDSDGSRRWRLVYEAEHILGFLVPFDDGWLVGGTSRTASAAWLAAIGPGGERRWQTTVGKDFDVHDAVPTGEGVTLAVTDGLVHVGADRSIRWRRHLDDVRSREIVRTTDEGYAIAGEKDDGGVHVTRTRPDGNPIWSTTTEEREGAHEVFGLVERAPNAYLVVGTHEPRREPTGWALGLNDQEGTVATPTASITSTPTPTTQTDSPTPTPKGTATTVTTTPAPTAIPTTTPGFSLPAAMLSLGAATLLRALRTDR